jgi:hypothetical protein
MHIRILVGKPKGKKSRRRRRCRWILEKYDGMVWTGLIWLMIGTSGGLSYGNEPAGSIKCCEMS